MGILKKDLVGSWTITFIIYWFTFSEQPALSIFWGCLPRVVISSNLCKPLFFQNLAFFCPRLSPNRTSTPCRLKSKVKVVYPFSDSHELLLSSWPRSILILWIISPLTLHFHVHQRELAHLFVHQASVCPDDRSGRWSIIKAACFKDISLHFVSDYAPARNFDWSYMELGFLLQPLSLSLLYDLGLSLKVCSQVGVSVQKVINHKWMGLIPWMLFTWMHKIGEIHAIRCCLT